MTTTPITTARVPSAGDLGRPVRILLVEDSPSDIKLTITALRKARVTNEVAVAHDGEEALNYLRREGPFADAPRPDLILLDLNMPRMDGRELLALLKDDADLRRLPVIVLTTSAEERDVLGAWDHSVAGYVTKPVAFADFIEVIRSVEGFWLSVVHYAPR
jgi:chemotaxis family two-component system response regulator Rcp1